MVTSFIWWLCWCQFYGSVEAGEDNVRRNRLNKSDKSHRGKRHRIFVDWEQNDCGMMKKADEAESNCGKSGNGTDFPIPTPFSALTTTSSIIHTVR